MNLVVPFIRLQIQTEWDSYTFELKPGESVIIGRSPDCRVPLPRDSVSQEHLRIRWTGSEMQLEDLGSSNGTFRMPQESPFASAVFGPKLEDLQLRLSKSDIQLSWEPLSFGEGKTGAEPTATEVAPEARAPAAPRTNVSLPAHASKAWKTKVAPPDIADAKTQISTMISHSGVSAPGLPMETVSYGGPASAPPSSAPPAARTPVGEESHFLRPAPAARQPAAPAAIPPPIAPSAPLGAPETPRAAAFPSASAQHRAVGAWMLTSALGFVLLALSVLAGRAALQGIVGLPGYLLLEGGIHDVMLIFMVLFKQQFHWIVGIWIASMALILWLRHRLRQGQSKLMNRLETYATALRATATWPFKVVFALAVALAIAWPAVWATKHGITRTQARGYLAFWNSVQDTSLTSSQRVVALRGLLPALEGSSLLYKHIFFNQRTRVLAECEGVGETAAWEQKRTCLVLLSAISIETLQDVRPALMLKVAKMAAILVSLDGITRTVVVEGRHSTPVAFFLSSLDAVDLLPEKEAILRIIDRADLSDLEMTNLLRELRKRTEIRMLVVQAELRLPGIFYLAIPGPLESGI